MKMNKIERFLLFFLSINFLVFSDDYLFMDQTSHKKSRSQLKKRYERCKKKLHADVPSGKNIENFDVSGLRRQSRFSSIDSVDDQSKSVAKVVQWPRGEVPVELETGFTRAERSSLKCAMLYFRAHTCLTFLVKNQTHKDFPKCTGSKELDCNLGGCVTETIGKKGGKQILNLDSFNDHCWEHGTIIHELMHVFGFFHEQSRMDRDQYLVIHWNNIPKSLHFQYWTTVDMGYEHKDVGKYDYGSVMHYNRYLGFDLAMSAKVHNDQYEEQAKNNDAMGQRIEPSDQDTNKLNLMYCPHLIIQSIPDCDDQLDCIGLDSLCPNSEVIRKKCQRTCGLCDQSEKNESIKIVLIGGSGNPWSMEYYHPYQPKYNSLINVTMIKQRWGQTSVVMSDGKIMTMGGGWYDGQTLNNVEIFDPNTNQLTKGPNMNKARDGCDSAVINGIVYVCGGSDGENLLSSSSCERYQSGVWEYITPMDKAREGLRLISLNGYLYAIGGIGGNAVLNSVEKYNPNSNSWIDVQSMQITRYGHGAAVLNGFVYVCEGWNKKRSCERYDPTLNRWSNIAKTIIDRRSGLRMVSDGQHVLAFAGSGSDAESSVEMYDPKKDKWTLLTKPLIHKRRLSSVVVLY